MNPYVSFALAMCAIVFLALFATSYMAVYFNRRAKADLLSALTPLALELNGQVEIDEATAAGVVSRPFKQRQGHQYWPWTGACV